VTNIFWTKRDREKQGFIKIYIKDKGGDSYEVQAF